MTGSQCRHLYSSDDFQFTFHCFSLMTNRRCWQTISFNCPCAFLTLLHNHSELLTNALTPCLQFFSLKHMHLSSPIDPLARQMCLPEMDCAMTLGHWILFCGIENLPLVLLRRFHLWPMVVLSSPASPDQPHLWSTDQISTSLPTFWYQFLAHPLFSLFGDKLTMLPDNIAMCLCTFLTLLCNPSEPLTNTAIHSYLVYLIKMHASTVYYLSLIDLWPAKCAFQKWIVQRLWGTGSRFAA